MRCKHQSISGKSTTVPHVAAAHAKRLHRLRQGQGRAHIFDTTHQDVCNRAAEREKIRPKTARAAHQPRTQEATAWRTAQEHFVSLASTLHPLHSYTCTGSHLRETTATFTKRAANAATHTSHNSQAVALKLARRWRRRIAWKAPRRRRPRTRPRPGRSPHSPTLQGCGLGFHGARL